MKNYKIPISFNEEISEERILGTISTKDEATFLNLLLDMEVCDELKNVGIMIETENGKFSIHKDRLTVKEINSFLSNRQETEQSFLEDKDKDKEENYLLNEKTEDEYLSFTLYKKDSDNELANDYEEFEVQKEMSEYAKEKAQNIFKYQDELKEKVGRLKIENLHLICVKFLDFASQSVNINNQLFNINHLVRFLNFKVRNNESKNLGILIRTKKPHLKNTQMFLDVYGNNGENLKAFLNELKGEDFEFYHFKTIEDNPKVINKEVDEKVEEIVSHQLDNFSLMNEYGKKQLDYEGEEFEDNYPKNKEELLSRNFKASKEKEKTRMSEEEALQQMKEYYESDGVREIFEGFDFNYFGEKIEETRDIINAKKDVKEYVDNFDRRDTERRKREEEYFNQQTGMKSIGLDEMKEQLLEIGRRQNENKVEDALKDIPMFKVKPKETFQSTKIIDGFSTTFRQWRAEDTHCKFIHGYAISFEITFEGELDMKNWVFDFGFGKRLVDAKEIRDENGEVIGISCKSIKSWFDEVFDHTTVIAFSDPELRTFQELDNKGLIQLRILPEVGCEMFAKFVYDKLQPLVDQDTEGRVRIVSVKCMENQKNSATYKV